MVIHTIIDEYDLLYAHQREAAYAVQSAAEAVHTDTAAYKNSTKLPDIRKGTLTNDNS